MPFALIVELRREFWSWTFGWCLLYAYLDVFLCSASIVHISVISLDRYFGIAQPLKMRNKSCTVVVAKIITVWLTITIISSPLAVLAIMDHSNILHENVCAINNRYYMIYGSTLSFLIPFIIMALTFLRTRYLLKQQVCALYSPATPSVTGSATAANASPTAAAVAIGAAASAATNAAKKFSATISSACGAAAADSNGLRKTVARRKLDYIRTNSLGRSTTVSYGGFGGRHKGPITSAHKNSFSSRTSTMTISGGSAGNTIFKGNASPASTRGHTAMSYGNFANENNSNSVSCQNSLSAVSEFDFALCTGGCQGGEARLWRQLAYIVHIIFYYCKTSDDTAVTIANGSRLDLSGLTTCETTKNVAAAAPFSSSVSANERILERYRDRNRNRENARYHQMNQRRFNAHRNHSGGGSRMAAALRRGRHAASSLKLHSVSVENEEKATRVLAFVFSCFFVCWTPFFLSNFAVGFCGAACAPPDWAASLFLWLGYASSTLNPIIYTVFNERFRQAFWRILQCQCAPSKHRKQQRFAVHQQQLQYTSYAWQHQYSTIRQPRGAQTPLASGALHGHDSSSGKWDSLYKLDRTRLIRGASVRGDVASADETRRHIPATAATRAGAIRVASPLATANHNSKISSSLMDDMRKASVCQQSSCYNLNRDAYGQQCNIRDQQVTRQHIHKANLRRQSVAFSENGENLSAGLNETGASSDGASPCVPVLARRLSTASACCLLYSSRTTPTSSEDAFARRYNSISVCNSNCSLNNQISSEIDESTATTIAKTSTPFFRYRKPLMKRKKNLSKDCAGYRIVSEFGAAARTRKANVDNTVGFPMSSDSLLSGDSIGVTSVGTLIDAGSDTVIKVLLRQKIPQKVRCFEAKNRIQ